MKGRRKKFAITLLVLCILLFLVMLVSVSVGSASLTIKDSLEVVLAKIPFISNFMDSSTVPTVFYTIIWKVRMPRIIMAALVGFGLAVVGGTFQGMFRNPLADPHILGVSSGAALGATIAILTEIQVDFFGLGVIACFAMIGAFVTIFFVYTIARSGNGISTTGVLLTGTALSTMISSMISLFMTFHHDKIEKVYMWTLGSFSAANGTKNIFLVIVVFVGSAIIFMLSRELNALVTGDDSAKSLGIETERVKKLLIVVCSAVVAACVSVSGVIGFVGLIIPHCVRMLFGADHRTMLPYAGIVGAIFMVFCDMLARTLTKPSEIPVGVITAMIGAPYFIFLLLRKRKESVA